ncbi:MAG: hypothetical protein ACK5MT_15555 [Actinomycetales bacterium]
MSVQRAALTTLHFISDGALATVYSVPGFTLQGSSMPIAFKEFHQHLEPRVLGEAAASAATAVDLRDSLAPADRAELDKYTAWPRALVRDGTKVVGLLMPLIPREFFRTFTDHAGAHDEPLTLKWLIATRTQIAAAKITGIDATSGPILRMAILAKLCYAVGLLHRFGLVYGDLSLTNAVFAATNDPTEPPLLRLIDCDAVAEVSDRARSQLHTPFWQPPELRSSLDLQTQESDCYKLGLAILRCLSPGQSAASTTDPDRVRNTYGQPLVDILTRALDPDPHARPTAKELYVFLSGQVAAAFAPPIIHSAHVANAACLRGQDMFITWNITGAHTIRVKGPNAREWKFAPGTNPSGCTITPENSGHLHIYAENTHGTEVADLGLIWLYELPTVRVPELHVPRPVVRFEVDDMLEPIHMLSHRTTWTMPTTAVADRIRPTDLHIDGVLAPLHAATDMAQHLTTLTHNEIARTQQRIWSAYHHLRRNGRRISV